MLLVSVTFLLLTISLCDATGNFSCQFYTEEEKSLKIYCGQNQQELPQNCVQQIPLNGTTDVIRLKIEGCDQSYISDASEKYPNVETLDISYSRYESLNLTGGEFINVFDLNVSFNKLTAVPSSIFSKFPKLETLDLAHNNLARIFNDDFKSAKKLMHCNLSYNTLEFIEAKAFDNLNIKSTEIILSHNRFSTFPVAILRAETIDIQENPYLSSINCTFIQMIRSKHVYFSWKYIIRFDGDENCEKLKFKMQNQEVEGVIPDTSNNFFLLHNEQSFKNMKHFIVGPGGFKNFEPIFKLLSNESVIEIDLSKNLFVEISKDTFDRFENLKVLNLSETGLKKIDFYLLNYLKNLEYFDISKNHLEMVNGPGIVYYLEKLKYLNAAENHIRNTNEILKAFKPGVQQLNLAGNNVTDVTEFERFTSLKSLNLSDTNITISSKNPFKLLRHLVSLDLSYNDLSNANFEDILSSASQLQEFHVSNCHIENASEIIQYVRPSTKVLDLSGNSIGPPINSSLFQTLGSLTHLNLSGINSQKFDLESLILLTELHTLDISHNNLRWINLKLLSNFTQLERLYLNDNEFTEIDNFDWKASPNVSLAIAGNQFSCMYLKDLKHEIPNLKYIGNQLDQKHGEDCLASSQAIGDFLSSVYDKVKFW